MTDGASPSRFVRPREPAVERYRGERRQRPASIDAEHGLQDAAQQFPSARPVHQRSETARKPRDVVDAGEELRPPRPRPGFPGVTYLSFQGLRWRLRVPGCRPGRRGSTAGSRRNGRFHRGRVPWTPGRLRRGIEGVPCELHHRRRTHEPVAVRGTGRHAQHALDAVHGVGPPPTDRPRSSLRESRHRAVLRWNPRVDRLHVREVLRSVDHQVAQDRKAARGPTTISGRTGSQHPSVWRPLTMTPHMPHFLTPQNTGRKGSRRAPRPRSRGPPEPAFPSCRGPGRSRGEARNRGSDRTSRPSGRRYRRSSDQACMFNVAGSSRATALQAPIAA